VAPFLVLQAVYNKGVTGSFTTLPWDYYSRQNDPYDTMSRKPFDPAVRPVSALPQKQAFHDEFTVPAYVRKVGQGRGERVMDRTGRLLAGPPLEEQEETRRIYGALPNPLLIGLLPVGLLGLCGRRWALWLGLPMFVLVYSSYTFFLPHYAVAMAPAVIVNVLAGRRVLAGAWPRYSDGVGFVLAAGIGALAVSALPEVNRVRRDQWFDAPLLRQVDRDLEKIGRRPAVVLFKYDPERLVHEEPVYNVSATPDAGPVVRAHDLGDERNRRLFEYYAARSPGMAVYRYDEAKAAEGTGLTYLGTAGELAAKRP
jgi:hypothetical protein